MQFDIVCHRYFESQDFVDKNFVSKTVLAGHCLKNILYFGQCALFHIIKTVECIHTTRLLNKGNKHETTRRKRDFER